MSANPELNLKLQRGAPASAVPRKWYQFVNDVLKYITVRNGRIFKTGNRWVIECGGGTFPAFPFRVSVSGGTVVVTEGYRCVIDNAWESYTGTGDFPVASGGTVYMTRTYPIWDNVTETITTPGAWSELLYGTPPANNTTRHTIRIATVTAAGAVTQEHFGNISVTDWGEC